MISIIFERQCRKNPEHEMVVSNRYLSIQCSDTDGGKSEIIKQQAGRLQEKGKSGTHGDHLQ